MRIVPFGDGAVLVELEQRIAEEQAARAAAIADAWTAAGHGDAIPAYASALLRFDPLRLAPVDALAAARSLAAAAPREAALARGRLVEITVRYDGPDLDEVARLSGLGREEVVALHLAREYRAFFVGFMPGFAYCGRVDERIVAPRLPSPRARVPAGAVAIADGQTAVYPFSSPGGWRLIGSTDVPMFDAAAEAPARIVAGDRVRFVRA